MIGLVDYDLYSSASTTQLIPNLEIMKLASYYKVEKNTYCRLLSLDEQDLTAYDKIYFFSESDTQPIIPPQFLAQNNVIYGGTAFTNGIYIPFEEELIDYSLPRTAIYADFLKQKNSEGIEPKIISRLLDGCYYRMYAGNNKMPLPAVQVNKNVYLYDRKFFYPDWEAIIDTISSRRPSLIISIHPIICQKVTDFFKLRSKTKIARTTEIILDLNIPLDEVNYMLKKYSNYFLADINSYSNIYLPLGGNYGTPILYYKDLVYKLNLLYAFWSRDIKIKIKFINTQIGYNNPIKNLSKAIERWVPTNFNSHKKNYKTLNKFIKKGSKNNITIEEQERNNLLQMLPTNADLFEQTYPNIIEGGRWRL